MTAYPLSYIELRLKERYQERNDIQNRILSHQELSEYIAWLARKEEGSKSVHFPIENKNLEDVVLSLNRDPSDEKTIRSLADVFQDQREDRFLLAGADISIGRMFRYMPAHWHTNEYFEVYYCSSGSCPIHLNSETIPLTHGSVLIIAPHVRHASPCYTDDAVLNFYMLRSSTFEKVFWNQLPADSLLSNFFRQALGHTDYPSYLQFETAGDPALEHLLSKIEQESVQPGAYSGQYLNLLMSEFFLLLFRGYEGTARLPRTKHFFWKHEFSAIFSYIQSHFTECTQAEIAAAFNYSERQLGRIVKNSTGQTYAHLIQRLRMERAAQLLRRGMSISFVAESCGYATLSSFYRSFTSYHGCTPAAYLSANAVQQTAE